MANQHEPELVQLRGQRRLGAKRLMALILVFCAIGAITPPGFAADRMAGRSTAELLIDAARDYGLRRAGKQTESDVLHARALLRAAVRVDPAATQAYEWLYELALLRGEMNDAERWLAKVVETDPDNLTAFSRWLDLGPRDSHTLEQRRAWLEDRLAGQQRPEIRGMIKTRLARLALQQGDRAQAAVLLNEALQLCPGWPEPVMLRLQMTEPGDTPADRMQAVLDAIRANPLQADLLWQAAMLLDEFGFASDALTFYQAAQETAKATGSSAQVDSDGYLALSRNALARGEVTEAVQHATEAVRLTGDSQRALLFSWWLLDRNVDDSRADRLKQALADKHAEIKDPDTAPAGIVCDAAWFYCFVDPQPQRALLLAENAAKRAPGDPFAMRVLGWAYALNGRTDSAVETLTPIADRDPYAAYQLAKLMRGAGDDAGSAGVLQRLAFMPPTGPERELLDQIGLPAAASQPAAQRFPQVAALLESFDSDVLQFWLDADSVVFADVRLENRSPVPGEPWRLACTLSNRGSYPITLGPDAMLNPVFLLSVRIEGAGGGDYPDVLSIAMERVPVLRPGESLRVRRTIDVGQLRVAARRSPQRLQSASVDAILDPIPVPSGGWKPSLVGRMLPAATFARVPANTDPEAWNARFVALRSDSIRARSAVLAELCQLLGEIQRAKLGKLDYSPQRIPEERVAQALLAALDGDSWETRAHTLDALQAAGLDRSLYDAATRCLEHEHWLVRMMAVRLLGRQGEAFADTAQRVAESDEDELVRELARSYLRGRNGNNKPSAAVGSGGPD